MKIEIKSIYGNVLFEYDCESNSMLKTLLKAIEERAYLRNADLRNANLRNADLSSANFNENTAMFLLACPKEGSFIAWKKASNKIVKLLVTENAKRSSATSLKCRCSEAKVLEIQELDRTTCDLLEIKSSYDSSFIYKLSETISVDDFDEDRWNECSTGIHFFLSRELAVKY